VFLSWEKSSPIPKYIGNKAAYNQQKRYANLRGLFLEFSWRCTEVAYNKQIKIRNFASESLKSEVKNVKLYRKVQKFLVLSYGFSLLTLTF